MGSAALPARASSSKLIETFGLSEAWADKLRHAYRYSYLKEAREGLGCNDSSINACSCLWNPLKFADVLMLREGTPREEMTVIIEKHFPDWLDAWRAATFDRVSHEWDSEY